MYVGLSKNNDKYARILYRAMYFIMKQQEAL